MTCDDRPMFGSVSVVEVDGCCSLPALPLLPSRCSEHCTVSLSLHVLQVPTCCSLLYTCAMVCKNTLAPQCSIGGWCVMLSAWTRCSCGAPQGRH
jgi:hypothetical protein